VSQNEFDNRILRSNLTTSAKHSIEDSTLQLPESRLVYGGENPGMVTLEGFGLDW
jgi:hypothetical protein